MQLTLPYCANILRRMSAGLTLLPKEILSRPVVRWRCNRKAQRPCLHSHRFSQTDNGVLGDACWNLSESNYNRLQSVGCYRWWYSLNSQTPFTFWITFVYMLHDEPKIIGYNINVFKSTWTYLVIQFSRDVTIACHMKDVKISINFCILIYV
jgi:hypothetical protein